MTKEKNDRFMYEHFKLLTNKNNQKNSKLEKNIFKKKDTNNHISGPFSKF